MLVWIVQNNICTHAVCFLEDRCIRTKGTQNWIRGANVAVVHSNGIFLPTLVVDGKVAGV